MLRAFAVAAAVAVVSVPASASAVVAAGPPGPDDHSPGCVTRDEFNAVKPVDREHFAPFAMKRTDLNGWFDARPFHVRTFTGANVGGILTGGVLRWQSYRACFGLPRWDVPKGEATVLVSFGRSPILKQSGFPHFRSTDVWAF